MRVVVDSSVWIDLAGGRPTMQATAGRRFIARAERVVVGDLVLTEILQGTRDRRDFARKLAWLSTFDQLTVVDAYIAVHAARNLQFLKARGIAVRKTIDTLIATRRIIDDVPLLYGDRDFDPFVEHLGLRSALNTAFGTD
ncbi:PIN domain-containing protein [Sphingomonas bacterium]|uniref:type II toxin-antitoxin system VapC family toxin n=1 Tax=Sphingomonas bacterium TaxID=1895847 RepID=UPI00262EC757|nr:PIN domain-containing protein [Sphingomonas bacterium]